MNINSKNYKNYSIVYDGSVAVHCTAAEELNDYVEKVCGFRFGINTDAANYISLGRNERSAAVIDSFDNAELKNDGFRIVFNNGNIYIFGNKVQATYFGMIEFMERYLGVKFFNEEYTYVPKKDEIEIPEENIMRVPYFDQRVYFGPNYCKPIINAHLKFRFPAWGSEKTIGVPSSWTSRVPDPHNILYYVDPKVYQEKYPAMFTKSMMGATDLCYSNGIGDDYEIDESMEVSCVTACAEKLVEFIKLDPEVEFYMIGRQDDRTALCTCEVCKRRRIELGTDTAIMMIYLNAVIKLVEKKLAAENIKSDFKIVTLAYQNTVNPPVKDGKPVHKNVVPSPRLHIRYAPIEANYTYPLLHEKQKILTRKQLEGWASLTSNIMIWDYQDNYLEYNWYCPTIDVMYENLKSYKKIGVTYCFNQSAYNINRHWTAEIKAYVCSRLYWDLSLNPWDLVDEYVKYYYGVAADTVSDVIYTFEKFFKDKVAKDNFNINLFLDQKGYFNPKNYPIEFLTGIAEKIENKIKEIKASDMSDEEKKSYEIKLSRVLLTPLRMINYNEEYYYPDQETGLTKKIFELSDLVGLDKIGEGVPLSAKLVSKDLKKPYVIAVKVDPDEETMRLAKILQDKFFNFSGVKLEIVTDNNVYPHYGEHAICVGTGMMFKEFYKGNVPIENYEYFVDLRGCVPFILGDNIEKGIEIFMNQLIIKGDEVILPVFKKVKLK